MTHMTEEERQKILVKYGKDCVPDYNQMVKESEAKFAELSSEENINKLYEAYGKEKPKDPVCPFAIGDKVRAKEDIVDWSYPTGEGPMIPYVRMKAGEEDIVDYILWPPEAPYFIIHLKNHFAQMITDDQLELI